MPWHHMHVASYQETLRVIQPIIRPTVAALRAGLTEANDLHERRSFLRRRDPHFYAHTVRRTAADELARAGLLVESEDEDRPELRMSGLLVRYQSVAVRIYRSQLSPKGDIVIPNAGRSRAKQAFWRQSSGFDGMNLDNILIVWRDDEGVLVEPLTMVRPIGGGHRRQDLKLDWEGQLSSEMATLRAADLDELRPIAEYPKLGDEGAG